jgi:23S rRNA (pseudouridine1915-N3)-methyltransferase
MLKVEIVALGRDKDAWISDGINHYARLLSRYCRLTITNLPALKKSAALSPVEIQRLEAERFRPYLEKSTTIALTDKGHSCDSLGFAKLLADLQTTSGGSIILLVGGAFGLADEILRRATYRLSLSPLTFSHQVVRLILLEQLYRGFSILHNTDYHK